MANVLKKIEINNPLSLLGMHLEQEIYDSLGNDEELAAFYHKLLDDLDEEIENGKEIPLKQSFLYGMIGFSTGKNINAQMLLL